MFLKGMTSSQMYKRIEANTDFIERNEQRQFAEWRKAMKRIRPLPLCFCRAVKSHEKDEFLIVANTYDAKDLLYATFAVVPYNNAKAYVLIDPNIPSKVMMDMVTPHFIKRYRERGMGNKECSTEKVVATFFMNNYNRFVVYEDPEDPTSVVYATTEGLLLCHRDEENGFLELATYIDDSTLYGTQRIAKEKMMEKMPEDIAPEDSYYISTIIDGLKPIVQEIYSKHKSGAADYLTFKKENIEDEVKLNFKLRKSNKSKGAAHDEKQNKSNGGFNTLPDLSLYANPLVDSVVYDDIKDCDIDVKGNPNGKGRVYFRKNGKLVIEYKGDLQNGKPNGYGVMKMADGHIFDGCFKDGAMDGHCKHYYPEPDIYEEGVFIKEKRHGHCHIHTPMYDKWVTYHDDRQIGDVKIETPFFVYEGEDKNGKLAGRGKITFKTTGTTMEGVLKNGMLRGKGKVTYSDGSVVETTYTRGIAQGKGKMTEADGTLYEGKFVDGELDGMVKKTSPDGTGSMVEFCYGVNVEDIEEFDDEFDFEDSDDFENEDE